MKCTTPGRPGCTRRPISTTSRRSPSNSRTRTQMQQAMEPRYDVRKRTPRTSQDPRGSRARRRCRGARFSLPTARCSGLGEPPPTPNWPRRARPPRRPSRLPSRSSRPTARPRCRASSKPRNVSPPTVSPHSRRLLPETWRPPRTCSGSWPASSRSINSLAGV